MIFKDASACNNKYTLLELKMSYSTNDTKIFDFVSNNSEYCSSDSVQEI